MDQEEIMAPPPPRRVRCVIRLNLPPAWTSEEDARLQRLAKENGFRHWTRVAGSMPRRRSARSCRDRWRHHLARDVYHRPFTARDDDELLRLHYRLGDRWKEIGRAVYGRTSRVMRRRWKELRRRGFPHAAAAARKEPSAMDMEDSEQESQSPAREKQRPLADVVLASSFASCSLACDGAMDPLAGSLALGFACMAV